MNLLSSTRKTFIICRSHFLVIGSCNLSMHPRFLSFQYILCNGPTLGATVFSCAVSYVSKASRRTGEYLWKGLSLEKIQAVFELPPLINTHARTTDTNEEPYPFTHFRLISLDFVRNLKDSDHPLLWSNHVFKPLDHLKRRTAEDNTRKKGKIVTFFFLITGYRQYTFSWVADTQCLRYLNPTGRSAEKMFTCHLKHFYTSWIGPKNLLTFCIVVVILCSETKSR